MRHGRRDPRFSLRPAAGRGRPTCAGHDAAPTFGDNDDAPHRAAQCTPSRVHQHDIAMPVAPVQDRIYMHRRSDWQAVRPPQDPPHALPRRSPPLRPLTVGHAQRRRHRMSAGSDTAGFAAGHRLCARLEQFVARWLPVDRRVLRRSASPRESLIVALGPVELRRTRAGFVARTTVKGERDVALQTALLRLADYAAGHNRAGLAVTTAKPVTQRSGAPGTWLVQIGLPGLYTASAAPMPRSGKVRIIPQPSDILAVIRLPGRPRDAALARGEAAIRAAIAVGTWRASGPPLLRLHAPPGLLPWTGGYEVALAVTRA